MTKKTPPAAINATDVPLQQKPSNYPEPFASRMSGRQKRQLGDFFGLENFGVNLTELAPGAMSALRHAHSKQDEFLYILQGRPTLLSDRGRIQLSAGMCSGVRAGSGCAANLVNETTEQVIYLEIGDRSAGDEASYPDDDLQAIQVEKQWQFLHKDGSPYK